MGHAERLGQQILIHLLGEAGDTLVALHLQPEGGQVGLDVLAGVQLVQQALGLATGHFAGLLMLDGRNHLILDLRQRLGRLRLVTHDVQHQRLAIGELDHVGVGVLVAQLLGEGSRKHLGIIEGCLGIGLAEVIRRDHLQTHGFGGQVQRIRVLEAAVGHLLLLGEEQFLGLVRLQTGDGFAHHIHERLGLGRLDGQQLDDVETERALHHSGEIPRLGQRKGRLLEGRIHHPFLEPVQFAALLGREGIAGVGFGQGSEVFTALDLGQQLVGLLLGRLLILAKGDQDVCHAATLGTLEQVLVLIVVILGILLGDLDVLAEVGGIEQQVVNLDLLVVHEATAVGLVELIHLGVAHIDLTHVGGGSQAHQAQVPGLVVEFVELLGLPLEGEFGAQQGAHQLLAHHILTQGVAEHLRRHAGAADQLQVAIVVELAVLGKLRHLHDGLLDLLVADAQAEGAGLVIDQRLIDQPVQHAAAELFHVVGVGGQLIEGLTHLGFHAGPLVAIGILQCGGTDLIAVDGSGGGTCRAIEVAAYTGQGKGEDDQAQDNLGYLALRPFA